MKTAAYIFIVFLLVIGCNSEPKNVAILDLETDTEIISDTIHQSMFEVTPISHASMVLRWDGAVIYVDPVGGQEIFEGMPKPDIILITDIHSDHFDVETLQKVNTADTKILVPLAVFDKLPDFLKNQVGVINNGEQKDVFEFAVEAVPMYNLRKEALKFHEKGRGNGYLIEKNGLRVYISGDTEDIPEMRQLENIDIAFVCMNLPYTMTVENAANAVLEFKPKMVYPYHYRGTEGLSDTTKFQTLVEEGDDAIEVKQLDWYPEME
ncbi:L-ascorbate metabolism protein UlaG (beta-lactamase superfamily) [Ulvibacter sp. MAR_2010_11]|uniref:MBL fold metallo-hydrolase n=1 Tax=Ulvibacter sp. MAR_2010_11 TaxID=1250229 RepID=UPI000C2C0222|nr:MBL fold metallo-hydrolase [Ulvibacter sp. MAR_2010_11]PKA84537.1 L-ascorbate metabolism protein UlaG (beta-lactamase superfamily) [Ulvibacter sp. MAR_2010_11]